MKHSDILLISMLLISVVLASCRSSEQHVASLYDSPLQQAAAETSFAYHTAVRDGFESQSAEIPQKFWSEELRSLNPIRVYIHNVNVVIVQEENAAMEKGRYVYIPISSYLPRDEDDGFTFKILEDGTYGYERKK